MSNIDTSLFYEFLKLSESKNQQDTVIQYYDNNDLKKITYYNFMEKTLFFNKALSDLGINKKDRVGIISENRLEWLIADFATQSTGIINVPTFPSFTSDQQKYIFSDCDAKAIICSNKFQLDNILKVREELEHLKFIITMDDGIDNEAENILSFNKLINDSKEKYNISNIKQEFLIDTKLISKKDVLTIIYTSGTTGNPKGVTLLNKNVYSDVYGIMKSKIISKEDQFLSFLPMCHAYERTVVYTFLLTGGLVTVAQSIESLSTNINQVKPTIITAVPKLLETVRSKILNAIKKEKSNKRKLVTKALEYSFELNDLGNKSLQQYLKLKLYDKLIFSKLRRGLGGKLEYIVSGGAALQPEVQNFFKAIGIPILQGYGLTECSPVVTVNLPDNIEAGTVGMPIKGVEVKIDNSGEILVRGDIVMKGYWHDDNATKSCIDDHNWFHTGDIGEFTEKGNLKITGRLKSIIVTSGGKNISPTPIEDLIRMSDFVEHIIIFGENKDFLVALISPEFEAIKSIARENNITYNRKEELANHAEIIKIIKKDLDKHQSSLAKFERVRKFKLLEIPFSLESGELTPKLSLKRNVIFEKYNDEIERMYSK